MTFAMLQSPNIPQSSNMPELAYLPHGGIDIRYGIWGHVSREDPEQSDKPMIIILPGLSEFIEKYAILLAPLLKYDVDALILDWPSQGLSGRFLDQRLPVHIDDFDQYLDAFDYRGGSLGIMQAAPGYASRGDGYEVYEPGSRAYEQNPGWVGADGKITVGSINSYYNNQALG